MSSSELGDLVREESKKILEDPIGYFLYFPFCPIKRIDKKTLELEVAFVHASEPSTVVRMNLFVFLGSFKSTDGIDKIKYDSVDKMLEDGWEVD